MNSYPQTQKLLFTGWGRVGSGAEILDLLPIKEVSPREYLGGNH
ncbi:MAG: hypothetical protein R2779_12445 [Crocinitomicaceae bacterium]